MKILVVDDDLVLVDLISFALRGAGHVVVEATDGGAALQRFERERPDLVILDVNLPGLDGFAVCRGMRQLADTPILMLTVRNAEEDHVRGLDEGADDYLTKPFSPRTLLAHVRALLRRTGIEQPVSLDAGDLRLNSEDHTMSVRGAVAHLTNRELRLVQYLVANVGRPVPAERLTTHIWGYQGTGDRQLLKQIVHRVRQKIEHDPAAPRYLMTVAGVGYMLRATPADMPVVMEPDDELSTPSAVCRNDGRTDL
ncbi:MAG TPA: response regulator transcription factor [Ktedonobacterales bacterium]|nr:response regulator transcription factor [Ktedonobacterales bacterium]